MITPDIVARKDIRLIITKFYDKLLADKKMLPFFEEIVSNHQLNHHLEIITDFSNDILFDTITYNNNVMQKHVNKNTFINFRKEHFAIWISYFIETIATFFEGKNSEKMKTRAQSIAVVMQLKMNIYNN
jgi:hemoglobin